MATVFLAQDLKHDRPVALKVLHPELAASLGPERFEREIHTAARLQHPHILTVHDSGVTPDPAGGPPLHWFTMPYVEGESLRDRLTRQKQLSLDEAVRLTRETALALDFAHRQGVIHRDIKPENILLVDGQAMVADFGIARALSSSEALTQTGMAVGTPAYMSPEQAAGERDLDARTDIYGLGCVLYEMLAGEPPFTGPTAQAIVAKALTTSPRPIHRTRSAVPSAVDEVIGRAMARTPADRYASAAEFAAALELAVRPLSPFRERGTGGEVGTDGPVARGGETTHSRSSLSRLLARRPLFAMLALGMLIGGGVLFAWRRSHGASGGSEHAGQVPLAVLPFENLGAAEADYFADGMTDEIRGKLSGLPGLQVIAGGSSIQYKKTTKSPQQIGQELGVKYLLVGKVRWEKSPDGTSHVRVSPELVQVGDITTPTTRWQQPFDAVLSDVFKVQADIAGQVAQALNLTLGQSQEQQLTAKPTQDLVAYDAYLQGLEAVGSFAGTSAEGLRRGEVAFERAVALDSTFALAWVQLSRAHSVSYYNGVPTPRDSAQAKVAAERALALQPGAASGHQALGDFYNYVLADFPKALEQYTLGRAGAPQDATLLAGMVFAQFSSGHWEEALATGRQAWTLDPRSEITARRVGTVLLRLRRYPEAREAAERGMALNPKAVNFVQTRAMVDLAQGDLAAAQVSIRAHSAGIDPTDLVAYVANFWDLYWVLDDEQQRLLLRLSPGPFGDDRGAWGLSLAETYDLRGDAARARAYADSSRQALEQQIRESPGNPSLHVYHALTLAYLGRGAEALHEGSAAAAQVPIERDGYTGPYLLHQVARIYLRAGQPEKALDILEHLLKIPYYLSSGWLRIDPEWKPLHGNPRFQRLAAGH